MESSKVFIKKVFIKIDGNKRYKSIVFVHNGESKSILVNYNMITPKESTYVEYDKLMKLKIK